VDARTSADLDLDLDLPLDIEADAASIMAAVEAPSREAPRSHDRPTHPELTQHQRAILDFERQWWRQPGAKEQAIRDNFEVSPTRYYQILNGLLDLPQALNYDPTLVNRLLRMRAGATRARRLR
jgi:uncharacterized protein DUF3263